MPKAEATFQIGVVSEAAADQEIARDLAERVLAAKIDWFETEGSAEILDWRGFEDGTRFLPWTRVGETARMRGIKAHGRFSGAFDERPARQALLLFNSLSPDAVVIVRDTDDVSERVPSLERARDTVPWPFAVVHATPHTKRECWVLNGFEPSGGEEEIALERTRRDLGFDPCRQAERLTARGKSGKKNAKAVLAKGLAVLPGSDREKACWQGTGLEILRERGRGTLLAEYLREVAERLVPLVSGELGRRESARR